MPDEGQQSVYIVAGVRVDPCKYTFCTLSLVTAWEGDPLSAAAEATGMISGVALHCACGNVQEGHLRDASPVSDAVEEFERNLKAREREACGPARLTQYEKLKLRKILLNALRKAASLEVNRQVCSKCGTSHSLVTSDKDK